MKKIIKAIMIGLGIFIFAPFVLPFRIPKDKIKHFFACAILAALAMIFIPAHWIILSFGIKGLAIILILIGAIAKEYFVDRQPDEKDIFFSWFGAIWAVIAYCIIYKIIKGVV